MRDQMIRGGNRRDMRNPYGSRGGYVRDHGRRVDYMNDYRNENDYGQPYRDMNYDYRDYDYNNYDFADMDENWKHDLKRWCAELKANDKFGIAKDQIISRARQMNAHMDDYDEEELVCTYYMEISDHPKAAGEPNAYIQRAIEFLEDKDAKRKGSDKLSAYYYSIVKGE